MRILILVGAAVGALYAFPRLLEAAAARFYHSYQPRALIIPDSILSGSLACPFCKNPIMIEDAVVCCQECKTFHHYECWESSGRCSVYGCFGNRDILI